MLAKLLVHPLVKLENVHVALAAYDAVRRPHAQAVASRSNDAAVLLGGEVAQPCA